MRDKLIRLHHERRVAKKRSKYINASKDKQTTPSCSCPMCCNPRRSPWSKPSEKLTLQERRAIEYHALEVEKLYYPEIAA